MLNSLKRFPLAAVLVLATALAACGDDDPADPGDDGDDNPVGTTTVTFTYVPGPNAPDITAVAVPGEFNTPDVWTPTDPDFQMTEQASGNWSLTVEIVPGTYQFKYHFNGTTWASDMCGDTTFGDASGQVSPQASECSAENFGNAIITIVSDD